VSKLARLYLAALPKYAMSRTARFLARLPLPAFLRPMAWRTWSACTRIDTSDMEGRLRDYRCLRSFFLRMPRAGARPLGNTELVWPCDGRIVTSGPLEGDRIPQVKGVDYTLEELLGQGELAAELRQGSQATIYLAPSDYHRVMAPFRARIEAAWAIPGSLFPVNRLALHNVPKLFARNARTVFRCRLADGRPAAVVMVAALMVTDIEVSCAVPCDVEPGQEIGQFGFGSTVVVLLPKGAPAWPALPHGHRVLMAGAVPTAATADG
jgi:phosphatidylserine decarboxylase